MAQSHKDSRRRSACCREAGALLDPDFFRALADPTRLAVFLRLVDEPGPATVGQVAVGCRVDLSVVSRHLAALRRAGLVAAERSGREVHYRVLWAELVRTLRTMADAIAACCPEPDSVSSLSQSEARHVNCR